MSTDSNLKSLLIEEAALARGLPCTRLDHYLVDVRIHGRSHLFLQMCGPSSSAAGKYLGDRKHLTRACLAAADLPMVEARDFGPGEVDEAVAYASALGFPVVVKPASLWKGVGVTTMLESPEAVRGAITHALSLVSGEYARFLVERQFEGGASYRFLVVGERVIGATRKVAAFVVGDGRASILELIERKNALRRASRFYGSRLIPTERALLARLVRSDRVLDHVPADGERVQLQDVENAQNGGEHEDVLDTMHPAYLEHAVRSVRALPGLHYGGVDMFVRDPAAPPRPGSLDCAVSEIEFSPAPAATFPFVGEPRDIAGAILEFYLDRPEAGYGEPVRSAALGEAAVGG